MTGGGLTYVAIATGFVYVAVILDAWSRRVVGYAIGRSLDARHAVAPLEGAVTLRRPLSGCVFHTDRGSQYASEKHRALLTAHGLVGSMSRRVTGLPVDLGDLRSSHRMGAIGARLETNASDPAAQEAGILPGGKVRAVMKRLGQTNSAPTPRPSLPRSARGGPTARRRVRSTA